MVVIVFIPTGSILELLVALSPQQHLVFLAFMIVGILMNVEGYLMVSIFISLMNSYFKHFFMFVLDSHISFL